MQELAGTTVILADDHAIVREGIAALCSFPRHARPGSGGRRRRGGRHDQGRLNPDFAILDLHMPGMTGVEAIRRLRTAGCTVQAADSLDQPRGRHGNGSPARGRRCLPAQRRSVASSAGCHQFCARRRGVCFAHAARRRACSPSPTRAVRRIRWPALSPREMEVFSYLVNGLTRQGHRRSAGDQPQDGGHLPCQPDA